MGVASSNFSFLESHSEQLVRLGALAERYFADDPPASLFKLRQLGEFLAKEIAAIHGLLPAISLSFDDVLRTLKARGILPRQVADMDWRRLADLPGANDLTFGNGDRPRRNPIAKPGIFAHWHDAFSSHVERRSLFLVHEPEHAVGEPAHEVIHGHLHHLPSAPGHRSVSVDQIGWAPQSLEKLLGRAA